MGFVFYITTHIHNPDPEIIPSQFQIETQARLSSLSPVSFYSITRNILRDSFTASVPLKEITAITTAHKVVEINDFYIFRSWQVKDNNRENLFLTLNTPVEINST